MKVNITRREQRLILLALALMKRTGLLNNPAFAQELRLACAENDFATEFAARLSVADVDALARKLIAQTEARQTLLDRFLSWFGHRSR